VYNSLLLSVMNVVHLSSSAFFGTVVGPGRCWPFNKKWLPKSDVLQDCRQTCILYYTGA